MLEHGALHVVCGEKKKLEDQKKKFFAQCQTDDTRQRCQALPSVAGSTLGKDYTFAECRSFNTWQRPLSLPSATVIALGKATEFFSFFFSFILSMHIHSQITYIHIYIFTDHIYITNSHISITYITKVHINPQVHHPSINKST